MPLPVATEDVVALAREGLTLSEIAEEVWSTSNAVRARLRRKGLRAVPENEQMLRHRVQQMPPTAAVEFLLLCVENLAPVLCGAARHPVHDLPVHLPRMQRRIFVALHDTKGLATREMLLSAMYFDYRSADVPGDKIVDVQLSHLRAKLVGTRYRINTHWGQGWTMETVDE
jgi:DNA-binding response OmpR family regulator